MAEQSSGRTGLEVAVIGMAGRFPGADDVHAFWRNLRGGVESISFFTRDELVEEGVDPALADHPDFVPACGFLRGADELDAGLFGLTPRDAEVLNPQHRVLLECAWAALEHAGYDPARAGVPVGVFAGSGANPYAQRLAAHPGLVRQVGMARITLGNEKDHVAAGIAYRLNLHGPALAVQTACSTSLVSVHVACQSLINGECDLALAGGVSIAVPLRRGYLYAPDGILSPDGRCRAFDAQARGSVAGSGAGVVVLRRLDDALADGDTVHAVIRGSAINNDGAQKVGYTAPSVTGQARVISEALTVARVDPATLQYLETHGSGTPLGDAVELKAIGEVLARAADGHPVALGSVKTNVGHLDAAAGVAGLIKTVLALRHRELPPSLNCATPRAEIEASGGRLFVNTALAPWERNGTPRRAGVSSFGIGGTNAHVVLEEAPPAAPSGPSREVQLLALSARTPTALAAAAERLAAALEAGAAPLADAAFTLQTGRRELEHRLAVACRDAAEGAARLREAAGRAAPAVPRGGRPVAFLFPGVGMHHVDMGRGLYDAEPAFRDAVDECCDALRPLLGRDLRELLYAAAPAEGEAAPAGGGWDLKRLLGRGGAPSTPLDETRFAQPAVFVTGYALAKLWTSWGVRPRALLGHSLGEYVAATVAGVLRLDDALRLVALRAQLIDALPAGAMLAVPLGEEALRAVLPAALDVGAVNTPESCVVSGPVAEIEAFEAALRERGTVSRRLPTHHAFHSRAMAPVAAELERLLAAVELRAPEIPFVSNVTGTWITDDEARSPAYWARHLCQAVRFADGVATLREEPGWALLEAGPGQALGAWALQHPAGGEPGSHVVLSSLRHPHNRVPDLRFLLETLGALWAAGAEVDWRAFSRGERRHRVPLPGYPFERQRYWIDAPRAGAAPARETAGDEEREPGNDAGGERSAGRTEQKGPIVMEKQAAAEAGAQSPRREAVLDVLKAIAGELTGIDPRHVSADDDLFRVGFDSLLLLQAIAAIEARLGVRVALVELLEEVNTLGALAGHLDRTLPADAVLPGAPAAVAPVEPAAPALACALDAPRVVAAPPALFPASAPLPSMAQASLPPASAAPGAEGAVERVVDRQLAFLARLMGEQLAAVRGGSPAADAAAGAPAAIPSPAALPAAAAGVAPAAPPSPDSPAAAEDASVSPESAVHHAVPRSPRAKIQPETFVAHVPVSPEGPQALDERQRAYLEEFIPRYVERTKGSKAHQARYNLPLADIRVTARFRRAWKEILYPIVSRRASGARVWDLDGNEYVDTGMAFGCALFGHAPAFVSDAIREQVELGYGVGPQSPLAGRAAELVCELGGNDRALFCNSGTEAVMGAVRAARTFTGRTKVAYFAGSYHGWSDLVLGRAFTAGGRREVRPIAPGIAPLPLQDVLILDYDDPASLERLAGHLHELAVVMVEPVQSRRPDIQPAAFLRELRRMTREAGVLLHFDELITGFRIGAGGAQAHFGVDADLVTYGKVVAGGLPMGVIAGRREVMDVLDGGTWNYGDDSYPASQRTFVAGAYFKHPISMAVACAVLEEVRRRGDAMYAELNARTAALVERMNACFEAGGYPVTAAAFGSLFRFFFGAEVKFPDLFSHHLILEGIHVIPETGSHFLSTAHTDDDVDAIFHAVRRSVEAMRRGGFIPGSPAGGGEPLPAAEPVRVIEVAPRRRAAAALLDEPAPAPAPASASGIRTLPLTEGQRQLWIESQMGDEAALAYIETVSMRLRGPLDVEAMRGAVRALVARHDTLRTTFGAEGDVQHVHPAREAEVPLDDLRPAAPGEVEGWMRRTVRRPFDLVAGPLVRFALAAVADDEHLMVISAHHGALDGWSFGVVTRELGELYLAAREGRPAALPPRADHAALVRAQVAAVQNDAAAQAYWAERFADGGPVLELPADRPRPPMRGYRGERAHRTLGGGLMHRLAAAGREHGLSLFHTVLAAYGVWLARLAGEEELVVGVPSAGQAAGAGAAALVGYGINLLPVRMRADLSLPFVEHARRVRRAMLEAVQHQNFSFPRLVETVLRTRDPSRPPLFSVALNLDRAPGGASFGGLHVELDNEFGGGVKVELALDITETADELRLRCDYSTDLFDAETVGGWLAVFERVLEAVAADMRVRGADLALAGPDERRQVLERWNATATDADPRCVHHRVEERARLAPADVAVETEGETLTYGELNARANRLAHHLARRGVGDEARVGICLERGAELVVAMLAVLKAGGAYVPLDPAHPAGRLGAMLADSGAAVLVTREGLRAAVDLPAGVALVSLDAAAGALAAERDDDPAPRATPAALAYVIYTSGSTGAPKGVAVEHRALANLCAWHARAHDISPDDRSSQLISAGFDGSVLETWPPLTRGARVQVVPDAVRGDPEALRDWMVRRGTTIATSPVSLTEPLLALAWPRGAALRLLVSGADRLRTRPGAGIPFVLTNNYGPTETTAIVTSAVVDSHGERAPSIGRPGDNLCAYVLDGGLRPVPAGVPGELYVGGAQVARGYLNRPALTAERFVPDPFGAAPGARLFHTGDRVRWLRDGTLEFLGRRDAQVKVRGFRIEPGEVEAVLRRHPAVRDCTVLPREEAPGDVRLVAWVVADADADALRAHLRERLPEYMVPAAFVALGALPLTPNGKVDRRALPAPGYASAEERYVAPRTPIEAALAAIWSEVLKVERVGVEDGFFELGGHSLLATRAVSRIREVLGVEVPLRAMFETPAVAGIAARIDAIRGAAGARREGGIVPVPRDGAPRASFAQERLWFLDRLEPGTSFYNLPVARRLTGPLDVAALERAIGEVVRRHEPLRTTFREEGDVPVQVIAPFAGFALPVHDLSALPADVRAAEVRRRASDDAARPFDLAAGPLFRAGLLRLGGDEHVLLMNMHHVISDGWSLGVLFRELSALYAAFRDGTDPALPPLAVQYADYAAWQRGELRGDALDRQLAWWKARLAGIPALMELPTDHPRPAVQSYRGGHEAVALPPALLARLRALGRDEGATLFMVLLGAFDVLMAKYCGTEDVVVGGTIAGRNRGEVEGLIGFFVNTLVLRTDLGGDPDFREVLRRVRETALGAYQHQDVPFERIVEEVQPERSLSHSPLFQVMFTLDDARGEGGGLPGLRVDPVEADFPTVKFDLTLSLATDGEGMRGVLLYSADLFEAGTVRRMARHLECLLEQVADDAGAPLSRLRLAGDAERALVLDAWNRTARPFPAQACLHERFDAQAALTPDALAVRWEGEALTYRQLGARANRLAHHLIALGVGPEAGVGVLLERGVEMVVAVLAVLKAGGCCVPVDTTYPPERMALMLADSGARVVLTRGELADRLGDAGLPVVRLDRSAELMAALPAASPRSGARAENLAYVFYTSGSTGRPKGVMMTHREVVQFATGVPETMPLGPGDRVAQASNVSFDAAVFELWGALLHGAALVGIDRDVLLSAPALKRALRELGVTHLYQTAALFSQHVREEVDVYASLKQLVFGAEAVGTESVRRMLRHGRPGRVLHEYGPTEATVWCTLEPVEEIAADAATVPIGSPIPNARAYVLDAALEPLPPGVAGELYVGGAGVVRGYRGRPSLTALRFVPDPFAGEPGARMYRTGDRVRWRGDGRLEFMGRLDEQVKIRGFRIEPGEVEGELAACPGVRQARVLVREDRPGDKRLVAYLVGEVEADALRAHLRRTLPEYMVPGAFVVMDRLPLTPNGKLDRAALPAPAAAACDEAGAAPRTPVEEVLAGIWAEVLGRDRVGAREGFFELGGHSLLATRVVSRVRAVFGVELPVRALFEAPTVAELAARVEALRQAGLPTQLPILPAERGEALPLSFGQERLWFLDRLQQGGSAYNVSAALRLAGALDAAALERAVGEVVRRHETLRTTFREADGVPAQVIHPYAGFTLPVRDLADAEEVEAEARRRASEDAATPFDLVAGPLFRASLLRLGADDHLLLLCMHHAVSDGWSLRLIFRELFALYAAFRAGRPSPLAEPAVQYADFAVWQREQGEGEARQLAWWRERLAGAPEVLELPTDRPRPPVPTFRGAHLPVHAPAEVLERLRAVARAEGATLFMVVLAAFDFLLSRHAATADVVVGTPVAGRTRKEVEETVGFFVNTLVLRTDLSGDPSFREAVRRVRETVLGAYEHQDVPFERLVSAVRPERSLSHSTLFQVMFQLDAGDEPAPRVEGLAIGGVEAERTTAKFDLTLALQAHDGGLVGALEYATDLFDASTAERMAEHLGRVLAQVSADPELRLSALELAGEAERARIAAWNRTEAAYSADACIHRLFEVQAARTPDLVALEHAGETLTYAGLDGRANALAHRLVAMGVRPEVRVGICLERGPALLVSILGVMKAGGAYVPMDPGHPAERLDYLIGDSAVRILLTQRSLLPRLPRREGLETLCVDEAWETLAAAGTEAPETGVTSENLAYVIYTSGSTGRPKGVAMHHRGVVNYIEWGVRHYGADRGNGAPVFTSMAVDLTITNLLPLFAGKPVLLLPEESPVEALAQAIRARPRFGLIKITPIHLGLLNTLLEPEEMAAAAHTLVIGADFLSAEPTVVWQEHAPGVVLMNEYGPTETVVGCSAHTLPNGVHRVGPVPVGAAIQNLTFHVLDAHLRPVPVGLPGELYIGGAGVARGYLGRPGLSAEKFVPDPFAGPGARMYRTGDRARWIEGGNLMILGRTDNQVKIRGYRVELGEIEAAVRRRPDVRDCIVAVREDRPGDRRLVAYVVADPAAVHPAALREALAAELPGYMVPSACVVMEALPQTPTGKLDRRALPAPAWGAGDGDEARDYDEVRLIRIWEELLGVEGIGPTQGFFELGGNSFLALRLFARVNRELEADLPLSTLFAGATVRRMAQAVREARGAPDGPPSPVVPLQTGGALPPLFVVHPSDRGVMGYVGLVRHLGAEQPVYGLRDLGDDLGRPIATIAAEHMEAVRSVQPAGPYYLAGWSFGGFVAHEMALQLEAAGETVAFVGLIDTMSPVFAQSWPWSGDADLVAGLAGEVAARSGRPAGLRPEEFAGMEIGAAARLAVERLRAAGACPADFDDAALLRQVGAVRDRNASYAGYVPGRFSGPLTLFRAGEMSPRHAEFFAPCTEQERATLCWSRHDPAALEVVEVPGSHATVASEPHVRTLAARMRDALAAARGRLDGLAAGAGAEGGR